MELNELKLTDKRLAICEKLGLQNSDDIINYYPYRYEKYVLTPYKDFKVNSQVCFVGELVNAPSTFRKGKMSISRFSVLYDGEIINVTIFNRPWVRNIHSNEEITVIGRYDGNNKVTASNYYQKDISGQIIPYYSLKEGISQNEVKKLIQYTYQKCEKEIVDLLPDDIKDSHGLIDYHTAIENIHNPKNTDLLKMSISRLKFEEFLRFYIALDILKGNSVNNLKEQKIFDINQVNEFINSLPYELTEDQKKASDDLLADLASNKMMYRLIQGEVGSGKTAVAMIG